MALALAVLFGLLGYFWLPDFAKNQAEAMLSRELERPVSIQAIEIRPYSLELLIHEFHIGEKRVVGDTFLAFERLYVDLSIESLFRLAPVIKAITLTKPSFHLRQGKNESLNISDLLVKFGASQSSDHASVDKSESKFSISNIQIIDGYVEFDDRVADSIQRITMINIGIPFLANFESAQVNWVEPYFNALVNDAPIALAGKARPFMDDREASLALTFDDVDLTTLTGYIPLPPGLHLLAGLLDSDLQLIFLQRKGAAPSITLSGKVALKQLAVENLAVASPYDVKLERLDVQLPAVHLAAESISKLALTLTDLSLIAQGKTEPALHLPKFSISEIGIDRSQQLIKIDHITLENLSASLQRLKTGTLDWQQLFESVPYTSSSRKTAPDRMASDVQIPQSTSTLIPIPDSKPIITQVIPFPAIKPAYIATAPVIPDSNPHIISAATITPIPERKPDMSSPSTLVAAKTESDRSGDQWKISIGQVKLVDGSLRFDDHNLPKAAPMMIEKMNLTLDHIDLSGSEPLALGLQAIVNQRGRVDIQGSFAWNPLLAAMALNLQNVDLVSLQGWAEDHHHTLLTRGDFSFQGNINAQPDEHKTVGIKVDGNAQLADFNVLDKRNSAELLRWKAIDFLTIHFDSTTLRTEIGTITLRDFFARLLLTSAGKLNLGDVVRKDETHAVKTTATPEVAASSAATTGELPLRIDQISLRNGHINFTDQFIQPNYRANLTGLKGQIGPIRPSKTTTIDILGAVDRSAPLTIKGKGDFLGKAFFLDLTATAKGIDMPPFSPYSGRYVGYAIQKGKLSVDVNYHVENEQLSAQNQIFLDQLKLGDKVESPDAVSLPLNLAISLLQNRRGEINLRLPLSGSINDPQFSIGSIIWEAFLNILTKAATAPFVLLGSLLGDDESLSELSFSPGQAMLEKAAIQRLQSLSQILQDRPALNLEITGLADPVYDHDELKRALLKQKIKNRKITDTAKKGQASSTVDEIELDDTDYGRYLEIIYKDEKFEKPKNLIGLTKSLPAKEMEELILKHTEISEDDLRRLAEQRASAAHTWLIEQGEISNERIFLLGSKTEAAESSEQQNNRVQFSIR